MPPRTAAKKAADPQAQATPDDGLHRPLADDSDATIHQRLIAVMADVRALGKNQRITEGPARFAYRGIDDVMNAVGPAFRRHGVYVTSEIHHSEHVEVRTSNNKPSGATRLLVQYTFYCAYDGDGGDRVSTTVAAEAWDGGDRGTQKAMSVALRTALLQMLVLPTGDPDPERDTYERADYNHGPFVEQLRKARSKGQALAIYNGAKRAGASPEQLAELEAIGAKLPAVTQGIQQQSGGESGHGAVSPRDEPLPDDDVAANDPALDQEWNPGHPPQQSDSP